MVGSAKRKNGILNNELYKGTIAYNRQRFVKDPSTGKRVSRVNPESEWLRQDVPELRIINEELWQRVQRRRESRGGPQIHKQRGPQRLLSGLIYCGCCGAKYNIATKDHMRCSARTNSGICDRSRNVRMSDVEWRVLVSLEQHLFSDDMFDLGVNAYRAEFERAQGDQGATRSRKEAELADVQRKMDRLLRLVEDGHADPAVAGPRLNELANRKRELVGELAQRPDGTEIILVGDSAAGCRKMVEGLRMRSLDGDADEREAVQLVRGFVRRVVVLPRDEDEPQGLEIEAGSVPIGTKADYDCNFGCGGPQPVHHAVHVLPAEPFGSDFRWAKAA